MLRKFLHISQRKLQDKLTSIYNNERENYEKYWDYINIFIKYGCLRDEKFYEKVKDVIIYKDIDGKYLTLDEYLDGKEEKRRLLRFRSANSIAVYQYVQKSRT